MDLTPIPTIPSTPATYGLPHLFSLPSQSDLLSRIDELNSDDTVDGLLVQLPVPPHISTDAVCNRVRPSKDVDGYTVVNLGHLFANSPMHVPATARGIRDMVEVSRSDQVPFSICTYSEDSCRYLCMYAIAYIACGMVGLVYV